MINHTVIALGETMLRMEALDNNRLITASHYCSYVGGSESNTLATLAQLGYNCHWLSRLPDHALAERIMRELRATGIQVNHVARADQRERVGSYFVDRNAPPLTDHIIYDRSNSAAARMQPSDLPRDLFQPREHTLLHTTGISLGISDSMRATASQAWKLAAENAWQCSFDFNYRAALWPIETAWQYCLPLLQSAQLLFISSRDLQLLWGLDDESNQLQRLRDYCPDATLVITLGARGAVSSSPGAASVYSASLVQSATGRIGRGDAFTAGYIHSWLQAPHESQLALDTANACAALKSSCPGDMLLFGQGLPQALQQLLRNPEGSQDICR